MKTENISISNNEKIALISNFATMLGAGISILEVVDSLMEDAKGNQKKVLQTLRDDLIQGNHVYTSFARFPQIFDKVTVNIIKASEQAGSLAVTLKDLKDNIQKEMEFNDRVKSALMYPVLIFIVFGLVMLMILIVVVPKISTVFLRLRVDLPLPTRILMYVSNVLLNQTIPLLIGLAIAGVVLTVLFRTQKRRMLNILFALPLVSELIKEIDLTRLTRSMSLLLAAGIPITSTLELAREVVLRKDVAHLIEDTYAMVLSGKRMSEGLKSKKGVIPSIVIKIIEAGEKTGSLDRSLQDISEYLDYQVSNTLRTLTALLEPLMLVVVGVLIGGMMLAIIAPIYGLIGQVGGR